MLIFEKTNQTNHPPERLIHGKRGKVKTNNITNEKGEHYKYRYETLFYFWTNFSGHLYNNIINSIGKYNVSFWSTEHLYLLSSVKDSGSLSLGILFHNASSAYSGIHLSFRAHPCCPEGLGDRRTDVNMKLMLLAVP